MEIGTFELASVGVLLAVLGGIRLMSSVRSAALGNGIGALAMLAAIALVLGHYGILGSGELYAAMAAGAVLGTVLALRVRMIAMPQMVALLNGLGGGASLLVALALVLDSHDAMGLPERIAGQFALIIGAVTLSGSLVAAGKLEGKIRQGPAGRRGAKALTVALLCAMGGLGAYAAVAAGPAAAALSLCVLALALAFGVQFTLPIGGADMPVAISLLNSLSGLAASVCGFAISDILLVSIGAVVGAAGLILTRIMCRAMNRSLADVLMGSTMLAGASVAAESPVSAAAIEDQQAPRADPAALLRQAASAIIVPGYGMALAQAQTQVRALYDLLESRGVKVRFAVHPVAGRMPGHMHVLLAEVDIPHDRLVDMDVINPDFPNTDVAVIVGACDVVNPAAATVQGTPISGMPVLRADQARNVIICNRDRKPGYSGVANTLYDRPNVSFVEGNAAQTLADLVARAGGDARADAGGSA